MTKDVQTCPRSYLNNTAVQWNHWNITNGKSRLNSATNLHILFSTLKKPTIILQLLGEVVLPFYRPFLFAFQESFQSMFLWHHQQWGYSVSLVPTSDQRDVQQQWQQQQPKQPPK